MTLKLSENALKVLERRYLIKDEQGKIVETPEEMFQRVAKAIARADKIYGKGEKEITDLEASFYRIMTALEFMPNSPALMNAGKELGQLSACFTLPIDDSMDSIFETLKATAMIHKSGGGTGFSFSRLRPKSSVVKTTGGIASGPVSFMKVYDAATEAVKQGGCVVPETRVSTEFGLVKIKSLGPKDTKPNSWHPHNGRPFIVATDNGPVVSDEFYNNGLSEVRAITTFNGYSITATPEHRLRVIDEKGNYIWKQIKDIKRGDWVALQKDTYIQEGNYPLPALAIKPHFNAKILSLPSNPTPELGEFVGFFIGDGAMSINKRGTGRLIFTINDEEKELRDYICKITKGLFGLRFSLQKKKGDKSTNYFLSATTLVNWFRQINIEKKSAKEADIPEVVFRAGKPFAQGFLRGLFSADGYVSKEGYPSLSSISKNLVFNTQLLLLSLGVPSRIGVTRNRKGAFGKNPLYKLSIITQDGIKRFAQDIGFISSSKNKRIKRALNGAWEFNDTIPHQEELIRKIYNGPGRGCGPNRSKLGANRKLYRDIQHYLDDVNAPRNLVRSRLIKLAKKHIEIRNNPTIRWFLSNRQFYDRVVAIKEGKDFTLDLSVPQNNTYIANGFVSHNTRRGANMGILRVDHPDILEFITCKENNKEITNFNISVAISDDFMQKLEKGEDYDLIDPHTQKVVQRLNTKEVFDLIVKQAHKNGEPGIIFIDRINQDNPTPKLGRIESTNPCLTDDTWIMTADGPCKVKDLIGKEFTALVNGERYKSGEAGFFVTGVKSVYKLLTKEGLEIRLTLNHPLLRIKNKTRYSLKTEWAEAAKLESGDQVIINNHILADWKGRYTFKEGYLIGLLIGDGTLKKDNAVLSSWGSSQGPEKVRVAAMNSLDGFKHRRDFSGWVEIKERNEFRLCLASLTDFAFSLALKPGIKEITEEMERCSSDFCRGLLRGLFDTDGTVLVNQKKGSSVRLAQSNLSLLQSAQRILFRLGIYSKIYTFRRNEGLYSLPDGKGGYKQYNIRAQHELVISNESILKFAQRIGFEDADKQNKLERIIKNYKRAVNKDFFAVTIEDLVFDGMEEVYDTQIPGLNYFDANGFVVHNCGEQPILPYESCDLGSINLARMSKKVGSRYEIDWNKLKEVTHLAVHFLDNLIDVNRFPLPQIEKATKLTRKIGLGVMGWASLLIRLNIPYNSDEAVALAEKVMSFILNEATKKSQKLAEEKGIFPAFKGSIYDKKEGGIKVRNATLTTIAPTGTISIIAGPSSSGIEPLFAISYYRKVMDNDKLVEVDSLFEEVARERGFYSRQLMEKIAEKSSIRDIEGIPEDVKRIFVTAHDISPEWHVRMQGAFQKYVHNATSKTINFPNQATLEDVRKSYLLAYELGCKGITIYRDKSRDEQVLNVGSIEKKDQLKQEEPKKEIAPRPRPEVITGTTTKVSTGCGNLYVTINMDEQGRPFELFTQMGKAGGCAASQLEAIGRLVSLGFRSGIEVKSIIEQLRNIRCPSPSWEKGQRIFSCADAIARVIEKRLSDKEVSHVPNEVTQVAMKHSHDDESVTVDFPSDFNLHGEIVGVCPDCGGALRHEEGCQKCHACGFSKC